MQVHGGYGYSSEYLPEAWLRDQKLNSIHEGTTGIQSLDLLGRKVVADQGAAFRALTEEIEGAIGTAKAAGVDATWTQDLSRALSVTGDLTMELAGLGLSGEVEDMMRHSVDYLDLFSTLVVGWQWLLQAPSAKQGLARDPSGHDFYQGKLTAAQYWIKTELPRIEQLAALCRSGEDSYARMHADWF